MPKWHEDVEVGDFVVPDPMWNTSSRHKLSKLPERCEVLGVYRGYGQSGGGFVVETDGGMKMKMDAGWFTERVKK